MIICKVVPPRRKEVRFFTRGEFSHEQLEKHMKITEETSIYTFTDAFKDKAVTAVLEDPKRMVAIDGGPHTLWWPTQGT